MYLVFFKNFRRNCYTYTLHAILKFIKIWRTLNCVNMFYNIPEILWYFVNFANIFIVSGNNIGATKMQRNFIALILDFSNIAILYCFQYMYHSPYIAIAIVIPLYLFAWFFWVMNSFLYSFLCSYCSSSNYCNNPIVTL